MPLNGSLEANSIYISLKSRPRPGEYHWGLVLTNAEGDGVLHHATSLFGPWTYVEEKFEPAKMLALIVLVRVGQCQSYSQSEAILKTIPADGNPSLRTGEAFTCRIWVKDVLMALHENGDIEIPVNIDMMEKVAVRYGTEYCAAAEKGEGATVINVIDY